MDLIDKINDEKTGGALLYCFTKGYGLVPMNVYNIVLPLLTNEIFQEELKKEGFNKPNDEQINQFILSNVRFKTEHRGRMENFMSYAYVANVLIITLNADHAFYTLFVNKVLTNDDDRIAFQLLLTALVKTTQELSVSYTDAMDLLFRKINNKIYEYMIEYSKKISQE